MTAQADEGARWRTIESAPKDGSVVLVYSPANAWRYPSKRKNKVTLGYWHQPGNPERPGGWLTFGTIGNERPTHWMPLPAPPQSGDTEQ